MLKNSSTGRSTRQSSPHSSLSQIRSSPDYLNANDLNPSTKASILRAPVTERRSQIIRQEEEMIADRLRSARHRTPHQRPPARSAPFLNGPVGAARGVETRFILPHVTSLRSKSAKASASSVECAI